MARFERIEVFGNHVISVTAVTVCDLPRSGSRRQWEVEVSAVEHGAGLNAPLLRFPALEQNLPDEPAAALDAVVQKVRAHLASLLRGPGNLFS